MLCLYPGLTKLQQQLEKEVQLSQEDGNRGLMTGMFLPAPLRLDTSHQGGSHCAEQQQQTTLKQRLGMAEFWEGKM